MTVEPKSFQARSCLKSSATASAVKPVVAAEATQTPFVMVASSDSSVALSLRLVLRTRMMPMRLAMMPAPLIQKGSATPACMMALKSET